MNAALRYWPIAIVGVFCVACLFKIGSPTWPVSNVRAKASIELDLSIPSGGVLVSRRYHNASLGRRSTERVRKRRAGPVSRYMLQLYRRRPDADVVRAVEPTRISGPVDGGGRILEFLVPTSDPEEYLETAELLGTVGTILRVRSVSENSSDGGKSRRDDSWRAFNVTMLVRTRGTDDRVRLHVRGSLGYRPRGSGPILLLSYSKPKRKKRHRRSTDFEEQEETRWEDENGRRRRRNGCRRRSLYVDFSLISYDDWVVAPPGYEAYQCSGKCFYPLSDHLSPTKHAIVQTLVHGALQGTNSQASKTVGRACCVPTRLAPTSLLYLDATGTLTYQYGYEDMVVVECGCR